MGAQTHYEDTLHYESRMLRDELRAANMRVLHARNRVPADLTAQQGAMLVQDWQAPVVHVDFDTASPPGLSGQPWWEELRVSLARFEQTQQWNAPTKHRAFYSALRTLLSEIAADTEPASQAARLKAAHTWWAKHRPRGRAGNPAASAALAASLAIPTHSLTTHAAPSAAASTRAPPCTSAPRPLPPSTDIAQHQQKPSTATHLAGTKHEFFAAFTKAGAGASSPAPDTAAVKRAPSLTRQANRHSGSGTAAAAVAAHVPMSRLAAVAATTSSSHKSMHGLPRDRPAHSKPPGAATAGPTGKQQGSGSSGTEPSTKDDRGPPLQSVGPTMAPRNKSRVVFDPDRLEAPPGPAPNTQGKAPSWFQGPYRADPAAPKPHPDGYWDQDDKDMSVLLLRQQQTAIQTATERATAHIEREMLHWATQRARLEEEMVRRQESSRYALPSTRHMQGPGAEGPDSEEVSAYAGLTREAYDSLAAGHQDISAAPDALRLVPGLAPAPTTAAVAQAERAHAAQVFEQEAVQIALKMQQQGIVGAIRPTVMAKALMPVPDKPYLECLSKLPRPGEHLPSRPGSVRSNTGGGRTKKKDK